MDGAIEPEPLLLRRPQALFVAHTDPRGKPRGP